MLELIVFTVFYLIVYYARSIGEVIPSDYVLAGATLSILSILCTISNSIKKIHRHMMMETAIRQAKENEKDKNISSF